MRDRTFKQGHGGLFLKCRGSARRATWKFVFESATEQTNPPLEF